MALPVTAAWLPGKQLVQTLMLDMPGTGLALPTGQPMHDETSDAPRLGLYVPAGHCSKVIAALEAPTVAQKPPTGQSVHELDPACALYVPTPHASQDAAPGCALIDPIVQSKHRTLPLKDENVPAGHSSHVC